MKYAIVTGSSKGLGESIAQLFLESGVHVIGLSRSTNGHLSEVAKENNTIYKHIACDLSKIELLNEACEEISEAIFPENPSTIYLVNNAGVVEPIQQSMHIQTEELLKHVHVNTVAPMGLTNYFLNKANEKGVPLISAIITSGAAESPMFGWSVYCSTKASMNMYTKTVALEQEELKTENKIIAFSPGIMDTEMQKKIRSSSKEEFMDVEKFKDYKKHDLLKGTELIGGVLVDILTDDDIKNGKIYYARNYL
ncbi:(S)-benzoin forming benzil reductase [Oceanobacillus saliphilus]|uniref:(S)-benzoin forming benzil reductase n=1 Tax=Oceanobacillus saliphilus TaxID=2925834 RepID=UPI00201DF803|nr:(S)-benzoin forming benzil reductase [Oceanobacillus saliphilus]